MINFKKIICACLAAVTLTPNVLVSAESGTNTGNPKVVIIDPNTEKKDKDKESNFSEKVKSFFYMDNEKVKKYLTSRTAIITGSVVGGAVWSSLMLFAGSRIQKSKTDNLVSDHNPVNECYEFLKGCLSEDDIKNIFGEPNTFEFKQRMRFLVHANNDGFDVPKSAEECLNVYKRNCGVYEKNIGWTYAVTEKKIVERELHYFIIKNPLGLILYCKNNQKNKDDKISRVFDLQGKYLSEEECEELKEKYGLDLKENKEITNLSELRIEQKESELGGCSSVTTHQGDRENYRQFYSNEYASKHLRLACEYKDGKIQDRDLSPITI